MSVGLGAAGCGRRSTESIAAEHAQDACIGALSPVADQKLPSPGVLRDAVADAEAAADVDDRWAPLLERLRAVGAARGTPQIDPAVDELRAECGRVNDIVKRGGKEPSTA
ncbi:MAG: hypothetical protein ACR2MO_03475 [Acidimicrobiales bacterium]